MAAAWNLLVYGIVGDAAEDAAMVAALADMRAALTTSACNVGVELVTTQGANRYWITHDDKTASTAVPGIVDASDPPALTAFLDAAEQRLGAGPTALVIYAHGHGLDDVHKDVGRHVEQPGPAPTTTTLLSNVELREAIAQSARKRVDVLALNACWMAMFEIEHELREVCAVAVASQVFAQTWRYGDLVTQLCTRPPASAPELGALLVARAAQQMAAGERSDAVSACRTDRLAALAAAFDGFATAVLPLLASDWPAVKQAIVYDVQRVDDPHQVDLRSLLATLGKGHAAVDHAAQAARDLLDEVVIANATAPGHEGARGLSVLCPRVAHIDIAAAYQGLAVATHSWATVLTQLATRIASP